METKYLTTDEACKVLRIKKQTLYKWLCEKKIPSYKLGGHTIFSEKELHDWIKQHRRASCEELIKVKK